MTKAATITGLAGLDIPAEPLELAPGDAARHPGMSADHAVPLFTHTREDFQKQGGEFINVMATATREDF